MPRPRMTPELFWSQVIKTNTCWLWTGYRNEKGYGRVGVDGRYMMAHRYAYEDQVGPIPPGLQLDHVFARGCRHKHCVNPAHLEPVTNSENRRRALILRTHCKNGHEYTKANTRWRLSGTARVCRACDKEYHRA